MRVLSGYLIFGFVPFLMILAHLLVQYSVSSNIPGSKALVEWGSLNFTLVIENGEWWRLFTCAFLHANFFHLASNLLAYYCCSFFLFQKHNGFHIFGIFMFSVFISSISVLLFSQHNTVGASGGVFGLMSFWALDALREWANSEDDANRKPALKKHDNDDGELGIIFPMLGQNLAFSFKAGISTSAHFGGFFAGIAIGGLAYLWPILVWLIASVAVVLIMTCVYSNRFAIYAFHKRMALSAKARSGGAEELTPSSKTAECVSPNTWNAVRFYGKKDSRWYTVMIHLDTLYLDVERLQWYVSEKMFNQPGKDLKEALTRYIATFSNVDYLPRKMKYPYIQINLEVSEAYSTNETVVLFADKTIVRDKNDYDSESYQIEIDTEKRTLLSAREN